MLVDRDLSDESKQINVTLLASFSVFDYNHLLFSLLLMGSGSQIESEPSLTKKAVRWREVIVALICLILSDI